MDILLITDPSIFKASYHQKGLAAEAKLSKSAPGPASLRRIETWFLEVLEPTSTTDDVNAILMKMRISSTTGTPVNHFKQTLLLN
jgi:hypothetical protein